MKSIFKYIYAIISLLIISTFVFVVVYSDTSNKPNLTVFGNSLLNNYINSKSPNVESTAKYLNDYVINFQEKSSTDSLKTLIDNESNISILDRELSEHEHTMLNQNDFLVINYVKIPYAVITNKKNTIENITTQQIKKMVNNVKTNWNEIDSKKDSGSAHFLIPSINLEYLTTLWNKILTNDQNNINYRFDKSVLEKLNTKIAESKYDSYQKIVSTVENDEDAIAIVPYSSVVNNSKVNIIKLDNYKLNLSDESNKNYPYQFTLKLAYKNNKDTFQRVNTIKLIEILNTMEFKNLIFVPGKNNSIVPVK